MFNANMSHLIYNFNYSSTHGQPTHINILLDIDKLDAIIKQKREHENKLATYLVAEVEEQFNMCHISLHIRWQLIPQNIMLEERQSRRMVQLI